MAIEMEKGSVSIDAQNIMPVIKRWLYSDKDIFLREVVSNGCDAITKYRMTNPDDESEMSVMVTVDKENKTLTISDTGIGMTEDEVKRYINQVAFSGASEFMKKFEGDEKKGDIIGHFGLGFYSVFMVSENVEIETLSCQEGAEPVHWESKDGMDFAISEGHRTAHGTSIILHISDEEKEFLELYRVREVLTRYCGYMAKPVEREEEIPGETNEDGTPKKRKVVDEPKPSLINDTKPLWLKKPSECEDKEYIDFYHKMFGWEDPLFWVHLNVDYPFNLKGILYFPKLRNDFGKYEGQVKLFAGQVFVADNVKEVIPEFLTLLKGVIDCPDLPLNVSRSFLQNDGTVKKLSAHITKKVADKLCGLFNTERETYQKYWDDIAPFVKFGAMRDQKFYEQVKKAILYKTTDGRYLTLEEYKNILITGTPSDRARAIAEAGNDRSLTDEEFHELTAMIKGVVRPGRRKMTPDEAKLWAEVSRINTRLKDEMVNAGFAVRALPGDLQEDAINVLSRTVSGMLGDLTAMMAETGEPEYEERRSYHENKDEPFGGDGPDPGQRGAADLLVRADRLT